MKRSSSRSSASSLSRRNQSISLLSHSRIESSTSTKKRQNTLDAEDAEVARSIAEEQINRIDIG